MDVQQRVVDDVAVFRIAGEHTPRDLGTLRAHVRGALETGVRNVVVDLRETTQLGCTGLGELISVHGVVRRLGGHLTLSTVPGRIRGLLAAANLESVFDTAESEHQAVARFGPELRSPGRLRVLFDTRRSRRIKAGVRRMGRGGGCLLKDEGHRSTQGSPRPLLINLTTPVSYLASPASRQSCERGSVFARVTSLCRRHRSIAGQRYHRAVPPVAAEPSREAVCHSVCPSDPFTPQSACDPFGTPRMCTVTCRSGHGQSDLTTEVVRLHADRLKRQDEALRQGAPVFREERKGRAWVTLIQMYLYTRVELVVVG